MKMQKRAVVVMAMLVMMLSACSTWDRVRPETPEEQYAVAVRAYIYLSDNAQILHKNDRIDDEQYSAILEIEDHVSRALDEWYTLLSVGLDPDHAREDFERHIERMREKIPDIGGA